MKNKLFITLAITTSLLLNTGVIKAHADTNLNLGWISPTIYVSPSESIETKLNILSVLNIITKNQENTILDIYYTDEITTKQGMQNQLDILVKENVINQSQEEIILNLFI